MEKKILYGMYKSEWTQIEKEIEVYKKTEASNVGERGGNGNTGE